MFADIFHCEILFIFLRRVFSRLFGLVSDCLAPCCEVFITLGIQLDSQSLRSYETNCLG